MSKVLLSICLRQCQADIAEACLQSLASHLSDIWQLQVSDKPALSLKHDSANVLLTLLWCVQHTCLFNIVWQITWNDISYIIWRQVQTKSRIVQIVQVPLVIEEDCVYIYTLLSALKAFVSGWNFQIGHIFAANAGFNSGLRFIWHFVHVDKFWISIREREGNPIVLHFWSSN